MNKTDIAVIAGLYARTGFDLSTLPPNAADLFELSIDAFDAIVHAWMSELPITAEIIRYGQKVLAASDRREAHIAASNRSDPDVQAVLAAAYKVWHEVHRLMGLLRFCPGMPPMGGMSPTGDANAVYIARCQPDHFVLPAFGPHFTERFGATPWAIIDEKRRLCLHCVPHTAGVPQLFSMDENPLYTENRTDGEWGNLWRQYHKVINNESRNNPDLQKRFMPKRYWQYLNELGK